MMLRRYILPFAAVMFLLQFGYSQNVMPFWVDDAWRSAHYPPSQWYTGFSQDALKPGTKTAESLKWLEKDAQNKMAESITVNISGKSSVANASSRQQQGQKYSEKISMDYMQIIQTSTNAEVAKTETYSYYDPEKNRIYAFAAAKKNDLANYYESVVKAGLEEARQNMTLAEQFEELGKKRNALEKIAESKKRLDGLARYKDLLIAVDTENGLKRSLSSDIGELLKEVSVAQAKTENTMLIYLSSTESILENSSDIMLSGLQSILSEKGCRMTEEQNDASYILKVDTKVCNTKKDEQDIYHCYPCIKADLTNTKTRKSELKVNLDGRDSKNAIKGSEMNIQAACEKSFKLATAKLWKEIESKIKAQACN